MDDTVDMIFGLFSEIYVRLLKIITSQFFSRYSKSYINLNVKSCLNATAFNKNMGRVGAAKLYDSNTTV